MPIRAFTRSQVLAEKKLSHQLSPDQLLSSGVNEEQYAKDRDALKSVLALFWSVLPKTFARIAEILSICLDSQFRYVDDPDCIRETGNRGSGSIPNDSTHRNDLNSIEGRELHLHPLIRKLAEDDDLEDGNTAATDAYDKKNFDHSAKYDASMEKLTQKIANWVYDTDKHLSHFFILDGRLQWEIIEYVLKWTHFGERFSGLIWLIYAHNLMWKQIDPRISSEFLRCIATLNSRISESNIKSFIISRFYILPLVIQNSQVGKLIKDQFPLVLNQGESV